MLSPSVDVLVPVRGLVYLLLLTITLGGLQLAWCTEFLLGTPFLLSLGVLKHALALIWIAGPLLGTIGQPVVGMLSDGCTYAWGRRRPFMVAGACATAWLLWYLLHSTQLVGWFMGQASDLEAVMHATVPFAALGVYLLDFSISAIQAATRAFIVDNVPTLQQQIANAWAARMIGLFNVIGYFLGSVHLPDYLPLVLGANQFQVLSAVLALVLLATTATACWYIHERNPQTDPLIKLERFKRRHQLAEQGLDPDAVGLWLRFGLMYRDTLAAITQLPPQVATINWVEFCAWVGYFPMLFYTTTYVGELYSRDVLAGRPLGLLPTAERKALQEEATRQGLQALVGHALVLLVVDTVCPMFIRPHTDGPLPVLVRNVWLVLHVVFIVCMLLTFWILLVGQAKVMVLVLGVPWGAALWAPFVLILEEVSRITEIKARGAVEMEVLPPHTGLRRLRRLADRYANYVYEPGIILGVHNMFVAMPQMILLLMLLVLFRMLPGNGEPSGDSLAWVFRFGGVFAVGALVLNLRVKSWEQLMREDEQAIES